MAALLELGGLAWTWLSIGAAPHPRRAHENSGLVPNPSGIRANIFCVRETAINTGGGLVARGALARMALVCFSLFPTLGYGVAAGSVPLDHAQYASFARGGLLVLMVAVLVLGASCCGALLAREADAREAAIGRLLRRKGRGPAGRWAIWYVSLALGLLVEYVLDEQRPGSPSLIGVFHHPVSVGFGLATVSCAWLPLSDLAHARRVRPLASARGSRPRVVREDDDVMGAIGRFSPPLLFSLVFVLAMCAATLAAGAHDPRRLLGGLGVMFLFIAALLMAPQLLLAAGAAVEPRWLRRGYHLQVMVMARLRVVLSVARRALVGIVVLVVGLTIGSVGSASGSALHAAGEVALAGSFAGVGAWSLRRVLWVWAPGRSASGPVLAEVLAGRERLLVGLAGVALFMGASVSLAAVLLE